MGRWGHRLFEADQDIKLVLDVAKDISKGDDRHFTYLLAKALTTAPPGIYDFYQGEYDLVPGLATDAAAAAAICQKLDSGLGVELLDKYISDESNPVDPLFSEFGKYRVIILAAVMMRVGAAIKPEHLQHLRALVPAIPFRETCGIPLDDDGFRGPGKRQVQVAFSKYESGTPRDFAEPSCHGCGKIKRDKEDGKPLYKCGGCKHPIAAGHFCNKACLQSIWSVHKSNCGQPQGRGLAVFRGYGKRGVIFGAYDGAQV